MPLWLQLRKIKVHKSVSEELKYLLSDNGLTKLVTFPAFPIWTNHYWFLREEHRVPRYQSDLRLGQDKYNELRASIMAASPAERMAVVMKRFSEGMLRKLVRHLVSYVIEPVHGRQMDISIWP